MITIQLNLFDCKCADVKKLLENAGLRPQILWPSHNALLASNDIFCSVRWVVVSDERHLYAFLLVGFVTNDPHDHINIPLEALHYRKVMVSSLD